MTDTQLWKLLKDKTELIFGITEWENYRRAVEVIKDKDIDHLMHI